MFKKFIITASIACVLIGSLSTLVSAYCEANNWGINQVYNGSYWGEKEWVDAKATTSGNRIDVWVQKGNSSTKYGKMSYSMPISSQFHTYYSAFVDGTGGKEKHNMYS